MIQADAVEEREDEARELLLPRVEGLPERRA